MTAEGAPPARHPEGERARSASRRARALQVQDVNRLLKQFDDMSTMMKRMQQDGPERPDAGQASPPSCPALMATESDDDAGTSSSESPVQKHDDHSEVKESY